MTIAPDWLYGGSAPFAVLCAAFALEFVLGALPLVGSLFVLPASLTHYLCQRAERRLNRANRSARSRRFRGAIVAAVLLCGALTAGLYAAELCRSVSDGWVIETVILAMCVGLQRPVVSAGSVRRAIARKAFDAARGILARSVRYETGGVDVHGLARGSVEALAVRLCDGLIGPVFWYLIGGLPGVVAYRVVVSAADTLSYRTEHHAAFGAAAGALDRLANVVAAPLAGALIVIGALFAPTARPFAAIRGMLSGAALGRLPREGWTQGAVAGALGLALAGPRRLDGVLASGAWIGDGRARATATDIARALWLYLIAGFIAIAPIAFFALAAQKLL